LIRLRTRVIRRVLRAFSLQTVLETNTNLFKFKSNKISIDEKNIYNIVM